METDASFKEFPRKGAVGESGSRRQMWNQESGGCSLFFLNGGNDGLCFGAAETDTPQREMTMVSRNWSSSGM